MDVTSVQCPLCGEETGYDEGTAKKVVEADLEEFGWVRLEIRKVGHYICPICVIAIPIYAKALSKRIRRKVLP